MRLKALYPKLVPLFICLGALPVLVLFSLVAGWTVWDSIAEGWSVPVYLQYGEGTLPHSELEISSLATNQPYDISLHLTIPATEANYAIGNFMTSLTMSTYRNTTIVDVRRPTEKALVVLPAPSFIPFMSRTPRLIEMSVPLISSVITGSARVRARLELGRKDNWRSLGNGEGRELSVYAASLRGKARPQGLRRLLSAFPLSSSVAASVAFFVVSGLVLSGFLLPSMLLREPKVKSEEDTTGQYFKFNMLTG
ncbi:hypothetical protein EW145_g3728 [Phellinidium pouzarii]|uniref:Seipin n=1 Tax=Phellinidium pouzarii TaxID=167371 RepID=A0A4S4LBB8_9AGAM|nr:hypothetical protein EW145_g3728 [Phellinidium pouzarii]